jgi:hypothetical protein
MDTRAFYKQDYEAQMHGRYPDVEERAQQPTGADVAMQAVDVASADPDEIVTVGAP